MPIMKWRFSQKVYWKFFCSKFLASSLLFFLRQSHKLLVTLYHFRKRFHNWPWSYITILFLYFKSNWTHNSCKRVLGNLILLNEFQECLPMQHWQKGTGHRTEWIENRYGTGMDTERKRTGTGARVEQQQNAFCQAFPVRILLIGTGCLGTVSIW